MSQDRRHLRSILRYAAAWNETDADKRREILGDAFADEGVFVDPLDHVVGREALLEHMAKFHREQPGARFETASGVDVHHGHHRFVWRMRDAAGEVVLEATNFGEVDDEGHITKMADFFGPPPAAD